MQGLVYSAPTAADLDGDGNVEIIVGTSTGRVYVLDGTTGNLRDGFPIEMDGQVQAHIAVEDIVSDGAQDDALELVVADTTGDVVCVDHRGSVLWGRRLDGAVLAGATFADVDRSGQLSVLLATATGSVWALRASSGDTLPNFPVRATRRGTTSEPAGRILSPVLPVELVRRGESGNGDGGGFLPPPMHLVVPSLDGALHLIEGATGCHSWVDLGEHSYSGVLADDLSGDGYLDLVVSTMSGTVIALATETNVDSVNAWTAWRRGGSANGYTHGRHARGTVTVLPETRWQRVTGHRIHVWFDIVDPSPEKNRRYDITVSLGTSRVLSRRVFYAAGRHHMEIRVDRDVSPHVGMLQVTARNRYGMLFHDRTIVIEYNMGLASLLQLAMAVPMVAAATWLWVSSGYPGLAGVLSDGAKIE